MTLTLAYVFLTVAIVLEVIATSALQASAQFTRIGPTVLLIACYGGAFYCLSQALLVMPVGIAYALWSALGIVLISIVSFFVFSQRLDAPAMIGIALIIAGVAVINIFSKTVTH